MMQLFKVTFECKPKRVLYVRAEGQINAWLAAKHFECLMDKDYQRDLRDSIVQALTEEDDC